MTVRRGLGFGPAVRGGKHRQRPGVESAPGSACRIERDVERCRNGAHDEGAFESPGSRREGAGLPCADLGPGRRAVGGTGLSAVRGSPGVAAVSGDTHPGTTLDRLALAKLAELDPTGSTRLVERVLRTFLSSVARLRPQFESRWREQDLTGVRQVAHTLKSASASVGALQLSELCAGVENAIRLGRLEALPTLVVATGGAFDAAVAAIEMLLEAPS